MGGESELLWNQRNQMNLAHPLELEQASAIKILWWASFPEPMRMLSLGTIWKKMAALVPMKKGTVIPLKMVKWSSDLLGTLSKKSELPRALL